MKSFDYLNAITDIDTRHILAAQKRLGYGAAPASTPLRLPARHRTLRRSLALAAALILLLAASFTTALATNESFRELVFSFLHIDEPETVPAFTDSTAPTETSHSTEGTGTAENQITVEPNKITIGGVLQGTYIHAPEASTARNGVFFVCTDEYMTKSGNHFDAYIEENGQIYRLEEYLFSQDYTVLGQDIHVEFQYVEHNGYCSFTYVDTDAPVRKQNLSGHITSTLVTLKLLIANEEGLINETAYPLLLNIKTGELTDILAGTGAEKLAIYQASITEDLTKMLLVCRGRSDDYIYYVDLESKQLYDLDVLSGEHVDECCLRDSTLSCWNSDPNTGITRIWTFGLDTMERQDIYSGKPIFLQGFDQTSYWGNMHLGVCFALETDTYQNVWAVDLQNGEKYLIEGLQITDNTQLIASADGEKLLVITRRTDSYYEQFGILDFSTKTYFRFSRENPNDTSEHLPYWFDNESILLSADGSEDTCDYYIYRLLDEVKTSG